MILLSNGGSNTHSSDDRDATIAVGTVDGVALLTRTSAGWSTLPRGLAGCFVSALASMRDGTIFAATHGFGVARSRNGGHTWEWPNRGIDHLDLWSARTGILGGKEVVLVGSQPAHLYLSEDAGETWRELTALRDVESRDHWCFPPPPRIGHVKDIVIADNRLFVGIEIGALLVSDDEGRSFTELPLNSDPAECDMHRLMARPGDPSQLIIANGLLGMMRSEDAGKSWKRDGMPQGADYPDAFVIHPTEPDLMFLTAGVGWPPHWYARGRARGKILRSRDGGRVWERLFGGLPDGQRAAFSALTIETWSKGYALYAADTDGQVFESLDGGDHWTIIADVPAVSKGEFYRGLVKDRVILSTVDDVTFNAAAATRIANAEV